MIVTNIGIIEVFVNDKIADYLIEKLPLASNIYSVDGRYKISVTIPLEINDISVECKFIEFQGGYPKKCIESGENLALISFYSTNKKVSIGTEGDISSVQYMYGDYGLKLNIPNEVCLLSKVIFYIAWIDMKSDEEDIYTWYAADPTLLSQ